MTAVARVAGIKHRLRTGAPVDPAEVTWLIELLESFEQWRHAEINHANRAYLLAHPLEATDDV